MGNDRFVSGAGAAGMFGALLWLVALFVEYGFGLEPPGEGALFTANQAVFFAGMLCFLIAIAGLMRAEAVVG